jgi:hypothetical protein
MGKCIEEMQMGFLLMGKCIEEMQMGFLFKKTNMKCPQCKGRLLNHNRYNPLAFKVEDHLPPAKAIPTLFFVQSVLLGEIIERVLVVKVQSAILRQL